MLQTPCPVADRDGKPSVRAERSRAVAPLLRAERRYEAAGVGVPDLIVAVGRGGQHVLAVGAEGDRRDPAGASADLPDDRAVAGTPEQQLLILDARRERAVVPDPDTSRIGPSGLRTHATAGAESPDPRGAVGPGRQDQPAVWPKVAHRTALSCPTSAATARPVCESQTRAVLSLPALTSRRLSGLKETVQTVSL